MWQHVHALKHKIHQHNITNFTPHFTHYAPLLNYKTNQLTTLPVAYLNNHTKYVSSHILWVKMHISLTQGRWYTW